MSYGSKNIEKPFYLPCSFDPHIYCEFVKIILRILIGIIFKQKWFCSESVEKVEDSGGVYFIPGFYGLQVRLICLSIVINDLFPSHMHGCRSRLSWPRSKSNPRKNRSGLIRRKKGHCPYKRSYWQIRKDRRQAKTKAKKLNKHILLCHFSPEKLYCLVLTRVFKPWVSTEWVKSKQIHRGVSLLKLERHY